MKHLIQLVVLSLAATLCLGCDAGLSGQDGHFSFSDATHYPSGKLFGSNPAATRVAEGALLPVRIEQGLAAGALTVEIDHPDILELVDTDDGLFTLHALKAGTTTLRATNDERTDHISITVVPIAETVVKLFPWHPLLALPSSLWEDGFTIFAETRVTVAALHREADGSSLAGFGATEWTVESTLSDEPGFVTPNERSDMGVYRSPASPDATEFVGSGQAEPVVIETVSSSDVADLEIFVLGLGEGEGRILEDGDVLDSGQTHLVHLVLRTIDGRYISGAGEHSFLFDVLDQSANVTVNDPQDLDEELADIMVAGRTGILSVTGEGEAQLSFSWGEHSKTITIEVEKVLE